MYRKGTAVKIKSVAIEGMRNVKRKVLEFDDVTYLYGPNGSGKSTVLNAVQLALLGYIPGTAKSNAAIMTHANCPEIRVSVDLQDESSQEVTVTRTFKRKGAGASSEVTVTPEGVDVDELLGDSKLPIFDWSEFTGLTGNKMKEWFIQFIPGMSQEVDWKSELSSSRNEASCSFTNLVNEYCERISQIKADSAIDQVVEANNMIKADLSYAKAVLSEKESAINALVMDDVVSMEDVEDLDGQLKDLNSKFDKANAEYQRNKDEYNRLTQLMSKQEADIQVYKSLSDSVMSEEDVNRLKSQKDELQTEYSKLMNSDRVEASERLNASQLELADVKTQVNKLKEESNRLKSVTDSNDSTCPYTHHVCNDLASIRDRFKEELNVVEANLNSLVKIKSELECTVLEREASLSDVKEKAYQVKLKMDNVDATIESNTRAYGKLMNARVWSKEDLVTEDDVNAVSFAMESAHKQMMELQADVNGIHNSIKMAKTFDRMTSEKYVLQEKVDVLNAWVKLTSANGLQTTLSGGGFSELESNLNEYIQKVFGPEFSCKFNVTSKANSFSFGVTKGGKYIPYSYLSTGEKTLYTFCLMLYIAQHGNSKVKVIMMDDFFDHLDKEKFNVLLDAMTKYRDDVQIVMAGVAECTSNDVHVVNL